ncbi:MAG TPA: carboxypeptidase-like regulatory domain-containing protein [Vicinamibacterales bacterium]|jgi:hypothetical protein|nr:carboxypeptidase-like regulatory domain-containing protein [Vicinamibacterales bacterium]
MPRSVLAGVSALLLSTTALMAQAPNVLPTHTISGTITDAAGNPLAGVTVELTDVTAPDGARLATSDGTGVYRFTGVLTGIYVVTFRREGFTTEVRNAQVTGGGETTIDVKMSAADPHTGISPRAPSPPKIVCGMTLIPAQPSVDPGFLIPVPKPQSPSGSPRARDGIVPVLPARPVKPTMRYVDPPMCGPSPVTPKPRTPSTAQ